MFDNITCKHVILVLGAMLAWIIVAETCWKIFTFRAIRRIREIHAREEERYGQWTAKAVSESSPALERLREIVEEEEQK